jgi:hypothetical protein
VFVQKGQRIPSAPAEGWLSDGRRVLHFKPAIWNQWLQELEITSGEWIPGQAAPLLKRRCQLSREKCLELWRQKRQEGWHPCEPQWQPPAPLRLPRSC